jgi:hypothetical protein
MVLNKPWGLAVQGGSGTTHHIDGMLDALMDEKGERPRLVHRLDRDTSGVLLVAKTRKIASDLGELFRSRQTKKVYWSVVEGVPKPSQGRISLFLAKGAGMGDDRSGRTQGERRDPERMRIAKHGEIDAQHSLTYYAVVDKVAPRLAWLRTPYDDRVTAEQQQAMERTVKQLRAQGAVIEEFALPDEYWTGIDAMFCLLECEGGTIHDEHVTHFAERSSVHLKELVEKGRARSALDYLGARALQQRLRADAATQLKGFDAILTIPATGEAPEGLDFTGDPVFCALWSFLGLPALTVPIARSAKGLPLGLQLIAPYKQDAHLLRTGRWVELSLPVV